MIKWLWNDFALLGGRVLIIAWVVKIALYAVFGIEISDIDAWLKSIGA